MMEDILFYFSLFVAINVVLNMFSLFTFIVWTSQMTLRAMEKYLLQEIELVSILGTVTPTFFIVGLIKFIKYLIKGRNFFFVLKKEVMRLDVGITYRKYTVYQNFIPKRKVLYKNIWELEEVSDAICFETFIITILKKIDYKSGELYIKSQFLKEIEEMENVKLDYADLISKSFR